MARTFFSKVNGFVSEKPSSEAKTALGFDNEGKPIFKNTRIHVYNLENN